jgi:hypothetical protein
MWNCLFVSIIIPFSFFFLLNCCCLFALDNNKCFEGCTQSEIALHMWHKWLCLSKRGATIDTNIMFDLNQFKFHLKRLSLPASNYSCCTSLSFLSSIVCICVICLRSSGISSTTSSIYCTCEMFIQKD